MNRSLLFLLAVGVSAAAASVWISGRGDASAGTAPVAFVAEARESEFVTGEPEIATKAAPTVVVYKSPTCGCCNKWVDHMREHGFEVETHDTRDMGRVKAMVGVPGALSSCHTAIVDGYVVEGHVPADVVRRMLEERPEAVGITVPGMPMGSPGMEGPYTERYDILTFDEAGRTRVYESR